ncbi:helix-turn-helix domain-containing protein [Brevibacillus daliensis]|uniref:helix-turn-helix domain-containing protein n=1 Tax=Brevibacillus daliensis TaxID=2892995 RepID=UPI001E4C21F9|nr:XRE family transcriptional regulator [Brevibacillus daliensis]
MTLPIELIGNKIRAVRKEKGFTLEVMATKTGLSKGLLSQVERGISQPSLESLWRITKALEAPIIHFFEDVEQSHIHIVRKEKRRQMIFPDSSGTYSLLSGGGASRLAVMEVRLKPGDQAKDVFVSQDGEECLVVIEGELVIRLTDDEHHLEAGDSIYFDKAQLHTVSNVGEVDCLAIWTVSSPRF